MQTVSLLYPVTIPLHLIGSKMLPKRRNLCKGSFKLTESATLVGRAPAWSHTVGTGDQNS